MVTIRRFIGIPDLEALDFGAQLISSGGGGDTYLGRKLTEIAIQENGPVRLYGFEDLSDQASACAIGLVGSVVAFSEKPGGPEIFADAVEALNRYAGRRAEAVLPYECAGVNAFLPLSFAAAFGLPILDADFMGRAFHSMAQISPTLYAQNLAPAVVADSSGAIVLHDEVDNYAFENAVRPMMQNFGGWGALAAFHKDCSEIKKVAIQSSFSRILQLGKQYLQALQDCAENLHETCRVLELQGVWWHLGGGIVHDVHWTTRSVGDKQTPAAIFTIMSPQAASPTHRSAPLIRIDAMHEFLIASVDGVIRDKSPNIVSVIETKTRRAIQTAELRKGLNVEVVSLPAPQVWTTADGTSLSGPRYQGINLPVMEDL